MATASLVLAACSSGNDDTSPYLVVADQNEAMLYVYDVPDHELVAEFDGLEVNDHTGFLSLPDGRVLFVDDAAQELVVLEVGNGEAEIGARVAAGPGVHLAVDGDAQYAVVSSGQWDDASGERLDPALTLVDLDTYESTQFPITTGEPGIAIVGDPLRLLHRNDEPPRLEVFPVDGVLEDQFSFTEELVIGEAGHGEAVSHERDRLYVATNDGIEVIGVDDTLEAIETTPWDVDGRTGGRAFYVRLSTDGNSLVTYLANRAPNQPWGEWENDAYLLDLDTNEATRIPLANGYVWRMGISDSHAAYFNLTPDGDPDGDQVHLLDLDADSATFGTIVASVALPELSNRATGDTEIWMQPDAEYRRITMTPDGQYVYVTNGGDGTISVIDTEERAIVATIDAPSALVGGGSVTTAQSGFELVDTVAR
jgi:YVTN family beta-propeller protein